MKAAFISTMAGSPWGGSEELWSRTAMRLCGIGHEVECSVPKWNEPIPALENLAVCGAKLRFRPRRKGLLRRLTDKLISREGMPDVDALSVHWLRSRAHREEFNATDAANIVQSHASGTGARCMRRSLPLLLLFPP